MRNRTVLLGMTAFAVLTTNARAQIQVHVPREAPPSARVSIPALGGNMRLQTNVTVPDRGTAILGGSSRLSSGRSEFGVPGLGKVPYLGRPFDNVGYGREVTIRRASASVRIIDLREEEFRQTGIRSR